ncbi:hypothetical protein HNY73_017900 [Argiope bruennichi]|uniref:Uncharacterized protein n=1 Tax=Argiope bruennichi TaxID=94029 RepID=A0A8T0EEE4_ARGBR|nr:hypothetical protein HNY73_017900 [Argiope bruennichi]
MNDMAIYEEYSVFRYIELDDARNIAKYGSIVHKSITYLDLNFSEYSTYKKEIAALKTDSSRNSEVRCEPKGFTRNHALRRKSVCPSLHLELPSKYTYRVLLYTDMCSYCLERDDKSVYVDRFYVDEIWYKRTFQRFVVLHVKQAERKLDSLTNFFEFIDEGSFYESEEVLISHYMNILCIECSDRVKGVFIVMNIVGYEDDPEIVNEYFIYPNYISNENSLPQHIDFGEDIVWLLIRLALYRFVPFVLKHGISSTSKQIDLDICDKRRNDRRRHSLMHDIRRLLYFHESSSQNPEITGYHRLIHLTGEALTLLWRSTPDVLLSKNEIESFSRKQCCPSIQSDEKFLRLYEKIVGVIPSNTTPRSLTHYSR